MCIAPTLATILPAPDAVSGGATEDPNSNTATMSPPQLAPVDDAVADVVAPNCLSQPHFSAFEIMQSESRKKMKITGKKACRIYRTPSSETILILGES